MPIFETVNGSRMELRFPQMPQWEGFAKAVAEYERLQKERKAAARRIGTLDRELQNAVRKDLEALKKAIVDGKEDPGSKHEEKAQKEQKAARRRYEALDLAIEDAEIKILTEVEQHRDEWAAEVEADLEKVRNEWEEAVNALSAARGRLARQSLLKGWLTRFPHEQADFRLAIPSVRNLAGPNGDPYQWELVKEALLADATPPKPVAPVVAHDLDPLGWLAARDTTEGMGAATVAALPKTPDLT